MFTRIINIFIVVCFLFVSFSYADTLNDKDYKEGEVFIRFAPKQNGQSRTMSEKQSFVQSKLNNAKIKKQYAHIPDLALVGLPANVKVADAITNLKNNKDILYIEPNYKIYLLSTFPNDSYFPNLWGMHNTGQSFPTEGGSTDYGTLDADIDAPEAWDIHTNASNIIVAVIDTGIDYAHPDLAANMWVNQAELVGDPNFDDDGNG
jgi:subtilisin family serine protease